jgi:uncharacterized protein (TIGR02117 family)
VIKKILIVIAEIIVGFIALVVIYLLVAIILTLIPVNKNFKETTKGVEIFVTTNGVHTNLCLPVKYDTIDWSKTIRYTDFRIDSTKYHYISIGWGEREFYLTTPTWDDLRFSTAFKALFLCQPTAMHVLYYDFKPSDGKYLKKILIAEDQYLKIVHFINETFQKQKDGQVIKIAYNGYANENFYEANGTYSLFYTCNDWTNLALKKAGIKTAVWAPFSQCVFYHLK